MHKAAVLYPLIFIAGACTHPAQTPLSVPQRRCAALSASATSPDSISVSTPLPIDASHAPSPTNTAERFAFAQSYETLIDADCDGLASPGFARSWTTDATKTRVTLVLRANARFWSGGPLTARDVVAAWQTTAAANTEWAQLARRIADATTIVDDRTLIVSLPDSAMLVLAEPALAVYRGQNGSPWPEGTGPYRVVESAAEGSTPPPTIRMTPVAPNTGPRLVIRTTRDADARNDIDAGVDLLLTADPVSVSYAATHEGVTTVPLPWDRTYVLVVPSRTPPAVSALLAAGDTAAAFRASLARDAVRAEARAAEPPFWWRGLGDCAFNNTNDSPAAAGPRPPRIVYRAEDRVARALAERLVGLGRGATAAPLADAEFTRALRAGGELAYLLELPRRSLAPCRDLSALLASAPWLGGATGAESLIPLVDTRSRAIVGRDRVSLDVEWDGTLRVRGAADRP